MVVKVRADKKIYDMIFRLKPQKYRGNGDSIDKIVKLWEKIEKANSKDWETEYLAPIISVKIC